MQCTTCNSDNVQRLSVVYEHGTQKINTSSRTVGGGGGFGGRGLGGGFGSASTATTGKSQSLSAKKASPPNKKPIIIPALLIAAGLLAIFAGSLYIIGIVLLSVGGFLFWKFNQYNKSTFPPLYAQWEKSWLCNKCGAIYAQ